MRTSFSTSFNRALPWLTHNVYVYIVYSCNLLCCRGSFQVWICQVNYYITKLVGFVRLQQTKGWSHARLHLGHPPCTVNRRHFLAWRAACGCTHTHCLIGTAAWCGTKSTIDRNLPANLQNNHDRTVSELQTLAWTRPVMTCISTLLLQVN